jgi:glucose-fructose oxidoreductase
MVGFAHMHLGALVDSFNKLPGGVNWVGCADVPPYDGPALDGVTARMAEAGKRFALPRAYADYVDLLDREKIDIALVCTDNRNHAPVVEELLKRDITVVVEKPMAVNLAEGLRMAAAAQRSKGRLIINWPTTWFAGFRLAYDLVRQGVVGRPLRFHYRSAESCGPFSHDKNSQHTPETLAREWWYQTDRGGGAMLDYCGYGCLLATWFIGEMALSASGVRANMNSAFAPVEDYSSMTVCFKDAFALLEGSWSTISGGGIPTGPVVYGTEGTLVADRFSTTVKVYKTLHGKQPDLVRDATPLPPEQASLGVAVDRLLRLGAPLHPTLDLPLNLQALATLDAGLRSTKSGKQEKVALP